MGVYDHILVPIEGTDTDAPVLEHVGRSPPPAAPR